MSAVKNQAGKKQILGKIFFAAVVLAAIFWLGLSIGRGAISLSSTGENSKLPANLDYREVEQLYDILRSNYDGKLSSSQLEDGLKTGLVNATGDPYTEFFNAKDAKKFDEQLEGTFTGIGAELGKDTDNNLIVVSPIAGFPAEKAGLKAQDIILSVDGTTTTGMSIDEAVSRIRGRKDTQVTLEILRNKQERKTFVITRDNIKVPSVEYEILPGNIGYVHITQFQADTATLTEKAANEFKQAGVKGVILDLRGNPGGTVSTAVETANMWLQSGKLILQEKRDSKVEQTYMATNNGVLRGVPTVVLINKGSASASEIVAGALKDNNAATLLGEKSYGKGSVQQIIKLPGGGEIKVTIARWYRPNGQNIDKKGIKPDTEIKISDGDIAAGRDPQKDKAIEILNR